MSNAQYLASLVNSSGNINIPVSNAGINFNNSSAIGASTLTDYETGNWSIADTSGAGLTFSSNPFAFYTKVGNLVFASFDITYPSTSNSALAQVSMPFVGTNYANGFIGYTTYLTSAVYLESSSGTSNMQFLAGGSFNNLTNVNLSGKRIIATLIYKATF